MSNTFLTTDQLAQLIHYDPRTIRNQLKDSVLLEGIHYVRPFGRRKLLFIWETIERDMPSVLPGDRAQAIPMANGAVCHG